MSQYDQWRTDCPKCNKKDCLVIYEVTMWDGMTWYPNTVLTGSGFEVGAYVIHSKYAKDESTYDEKARCVQCGAEFDLYDLVLTQ